MQLTDANSVMLFHRCVDGAGLFLIHNTCRGFRYQFYSSFHSLRMGWKDWQVWLSIHFKHVLQIVTALLHCCWGLRNVPVIYVDHFIVKFCIIVDWKHFKELSFLNFFRVTLTRKPRKKMLLLVLSVLQVGFIPLDVHCIVS